MASSIIPRKYRNFTGNYVFFTFSDRVELLLHRNCILIIFISENPIIMKATITRNKSSLFARTFRLFVEQLMESFESPQARQFRLLKKLVAE